MKPCLIAGSIVGMAKINENMYTNAYLKFHFLEQMQSSVLVG